MFPGGVGHEAFPVRTSTNSSSGGIFLSGMTEAAQDLKREFSEIQTFRRYLKYTGNFCGVVAV